MRSLRKTIAVIITMAISLLIAGCSKSDIPETECIISWGGNETIMENGIYYTCSNDDGDNILCYYSKENGRTVPVCGSPSCTHTSKRSPDCAALVDNIFGFYSRGDSLYYFTENIDNNSIDLMVCSLNGLNKRTVSSVEDTFIPFIKGVEYDDDYVLLSYNILYELDEEKLESGIGGSVSLELDKPKVFIKKIDLNSGEATTLVEKEGYNASIWGGVIEDDILYYAFSENTDKLEIDQETGEYVGGLKREDVYRYGYYALDTKDGTERKLSADYDCLAPIAPCFDHFSKDTVCYSMTDDKLYKFDSETGEFEYFADCYNASLNYVCDERDALFLKTPDAENYTRYNFETGAFTEIPRRECPLGEVYLNGVYLIGETAWFDYSADDGSYCMGYVSREDFLNGDFSNAVFAFDMNNFNNGNNNYSSEAISDDDKSQNSIDDNIPQDDPVTLKWGIESCSVTDREVELLNEKLRENGYNFDVDIIQLAHDDIMDTSNFSELVAEYEAANGPLDIVTIGSDWSDKRGAAYNFIEDGYFRELTPSDKLRKVIPEALWSSVEVNGNIYTIPGRCFNDSGVTYYFNKKYIDEKLISDFDGDISELPKILNSVTPTEDLVALKYDIDYLDHLSSIPLCSKGKLVLNDKMGKSENPYENADIIEYAKTLNSLYQSGYLNYDVNFSDYDADGESLDAKTEIAVMVSPCVLTDLSLYFPDGSDMIAVSLPCYVENRVAASTGISTKCDNPEVAMEFLELLQLDATYRDILEPENFSNSFSMGLPSEQFPKNDELIPSRFAGFELTYDKITDYTDIANALLQNYDRLCKTDDFDKELSAINSELKASGIDDYVALVNSLLEEYNNALANQ